jgi:hypothetical protein
MNDGKFTPLLVLYGSIFCRRIRQKLGPIGPSDEKAVERACRAGCLNVGRGAAEVDDALAGDSHTHEIACLGSKGHLSPSVAAKYCLSKSALNHSICLSYLCLIHSLDSQRFRWFDCLNA